MELTFTIPGKALPGLQRQVDRYNRAAASQLSLQAWVELHLRELAITDELADVAETARKQAERAAQEGLEANIAAERLRLLDGLVDGAVVGRVE